MLNKITYKDSQELQESQLTAIVDAASEVYRANGNKLIRILDLATGPNNFNPVVVQALNNRSIDYELVLSDISPSNMIRGYKNLEEVMMTEQLKKVKVILVDSNNLRKQHKRIPIYNDDGSTTYQLLKSILQKPEFHFLSSGYNGSRRTEKFVSKTFDLVIGQIPYGSMQEYDKAIDESVRVLRNGGYHIVNEWQVEELNEDIERTPAAMRGARVKHVDNIAMKLDAKLIPVALYTCNHPYEADYYEPDELVQNGDILKDAIFVHRKKYNYQSK